MDQLPPLPVCVILGREVGEVLLLQRKAPWCSIGDHHAHRRVVVARLDLLGKIAVSNAKLAFELHKEEFQSDRFAEIKAEGGRAQRVLWASTSTKNPEYPDTLYVDELIGPETVNTMPPNTIDAFRDHGLLENTLEKDTEQAKAVMHDIAELDINMQNVTQLLQEKGVEAFSLSYNQLLAALVTKITGSS